MDAGLQDHICVVILLYSQPAETQHRHTPGADSCLAYLLINLSDFITSWLLARTNKIILCSLMSGRNIITYRWEITITLLHSHTVSSHSPVYPGQHDSPFPSSLATRTNELHSQSSAADVNISTIICCGKYEAFGQI